MSLFVSPLFENLLWWSGRRDPALVLGLKTLLTTYGWTIAFFVLVSFNYASVSQFQLKPSSGEPTLGLVKQSEKTQNNFLTYVKSQWYRFWTVKY